MARMRPAQLLRHGNGPVAFVHVVSGAARAKGASGVGCCMNHAWWRKSIQITTHRQVFVDRKLLYPTHCPKIDPAKPAGGARLWRGCSGWRTIIHSTVQRMGQVTTLGFRPPARNSCCSRRGDVGFGQRSGWADFADDVGEGCRPARWCGRCRWMTSSRSCTKMASGWVELRWSWGQSPPTLGPEVEAALGAQAPVAPARSTHLAGLGLGEGEVLRHVHRCRLCAWARDAVAAKAQVH